MKMARCFFLLLGIAATDSAHAAIINLTTPGVRSNISIGFNSTVARDTGLSSTSGSGNLTATVDDVADTGFFSSAEVGMVLPGTNRTFQRTFITPPTNFPDPPIQTTLTETLAIDPISLPILFESSSTATLGYVVPLQLYRFSSNVRLLFPDSVTLSGTYTIQGPTETVSRPVNIVYGRTTSSGTVNGNWIGFIRVGPNYPDTTRMGAIDILTFYPTYVPTTTTTIFQGTVDGIDVTARFGNGSSYVTLPMPVPETASVFTLVVGLAIWPIAFVYRGNRA
jgi:hypothetical protein